MYTSKGAAHATAYLTGFVAEPNKRAVPTFVKFRLQNSGRLASICIQWHLNLNHAQISALKEGWYGEDTNITTIEYWKILLQEAKVALNQISKMAPIGIASEPEVSFEVVHTRMPDGHQIESGFITIDYTPKKQYT